MLKNTLINRAATKKIALALGELNEKVVYVGGAMISSYIDDPAADDVRPTKDIDITLEIASIGELEQLRVLLLGKGFVQSHKDDVICRFRFEDIKVDVMATQAIGWAPANPWFEAGFAQKISMELDGLTIHILPLPYFLATKFTAFYDRGITDPRTSHDFEDIVYLLNYTSDLKDQIESSDEDVRAYLKECFVEVLNNDIMREAILGNLHHENQTVRFDRVMALLKDCC